MTEPAQTVSAQLALDAAARLLSNNVRTVAADLGVSDRHLRRVFFETVGMSPSHSPSSRFRRAVRAAGERTHGLGHIAASTGYFDQAHLVAEFARSRA